MIIVFGSMNIDFLVRLSHLPREGETVVTSGEYAQAPGGKGMNQAVAAARAGAIVKMAGKVGNDTFGATVRSILAEEGIDGALVGSSTKKTGVALIFVDEKGGDQIVVAGGANTEAQASQVTDDVLKRTTTLVLQMEVRPEENWELLERASKGGVRRILNVAPAAPVPEDALRNIDYLILNEVEAQQIAVGAGFEPSLLDYKAQALFLSGRYGLTCIITLGEQGAIAADSGNIVETPALALSRVVDTTGAGDCFCGNFAAAMDAGFSLRTAIARACIAGSLACRSMGAQSSMPRRDELEKIVKPVRRP